MRTSVRWDCDTRGNPGCDVSAAVTFICHVEGREVALCRSCDKTWKGYARDNPGLELRCPNCAPGFLLRQKAATDTAAGRVPKSEQVLTGPLADIVNEAMYRQGVLVDVRQKVLASLWREAFEHDGYAAMLIRSTVPKPTEVAAVSGAKS